MSPFRHSSGQASKENVSYSEKAQPVSESTTSEEFTTTRSPMHHRDDDGPPPLNYTLKTGTRERWIAIFFILLFIDAGVLPLILFYSLRNHLSIAKTLKIIMGLAGIVSGLQVTYRSWLLLPMNGHESRRPIGGSRWGLDFFK